MEFVLGPIRRWKRSRLAWTILATFVLAIAGTTIVFQTMSAKPIWDHNGPGYLDPNASVSNEEQKRVLDTIGTLPQINDVYLAKTKDGKLVVSATIDLASDNSKSTQMTGVAAQMSDLSRAMELAEQFTEKVYELHLPVAQSMLNVTKNGVYVAGAGLGLQQEQMLQQTILHWSSPTAFADWLQKFQHEDVNLENNTFFYTASNLP